MAATTKETETHAQHSSLASSLEENLALLPRKAEASDIVEMPYDKAFVPAIVTAVACGYLRAAFLLETERQRSIREQFTQCVDQPGFWEIMERLAYYMNDDSVYPVDLNGDQAFKPQLPDNKSDLVKRLPAIFTGTVEYQAKFLKHSWLVFDKVATHIIPSRGMGGFFSGNMHYDTSCVCVHQTVWGERGMGYVLDPYTARTGIVATGTTTIFGSRFRHESSPVEQIAVLTYIDDMAHKVELANNI